MEQIHDLSGLFFLSEGQAQSLPRSTHDRIVLKYGDEFTTQWFPSMEMSITQDQGFLVLNGTKHDSVIVKNLPKALKGWNAS